MRPEVFGADAVIVGEPGERVLRIALGAVHLGAIARGDDRRLARGLRLNEFLQRALQILGRERDPLAQGEGRGLVVEAESEDLHAKRLVRIPRDGRPQCRQNRRWPQPRFSPEGNAYEKYSRLKRFPSFDPCQNDLRSGQGSRTSPLRRNIREPRASR